MPHWLIKTAAHRAIAWLPRRQFWNGLFQKYITKSTVPTPLLFETKLAECRRHLDALFSLRPCASEFRALEVGTGWFPVLPIGLYLCGAREVWTFDIDPLLSAHWTARLLGYLSDYDHRGELAKFLPAYRPERMGLLRELMSTASQASPRATLERMQIHAVVADAQGTGLPDKSIDYFFSNGVLEYVPRRVLEGMLAEFRRLATARAVMSHRLNLVDAFSYFDQSITAFNLLRYTARQWRWRNSPLIWQNRLRISDYRDLLRGAGFEIVREENISGSADDLAKVPLAPEFQHYTREDLLIIHSFLIARLRAG